jgi:hypothetical protein
MDLGGVLGGDGVGFCLRVLEGLLEMLELGSGIRTPYSAAR